MKTALTVFVCSTFSDLSDERELVLDAIRRLRLQHDSMEFFGARAQQPIETCLEEVRQSDILVVIVGHRYGSIVSELGISFSEAEYAEGYRLQKPCLVYIRDDNVPILPKYMEQDPEKLRLLERWKATLQERHTVATFREGKDLAVQVVADLTRTIQMLENAARVREEAQTEATGIFANELNDLVQHALNQGATQAAVLSAVRRAVSSVIATEVGRKTTIFLSYASADKEIVQKVATGLQKAGISVWFDQVSLKPGTQFLREIERGLDSADFVAFFISKNSVASVGAQRELDLAVYREVSGERGAVILPILLDDAGVPPLLRSIQWLDLRDKDVDKCIEKMVGAIEFHSQRQRPSEKRKGAR